jgi:histidinol-phosphate/aromatic aminotransferase/cobyric acid decarboxylase-like protein
MKIVSFVYQHRAIKKIYYERPNGGIVFPNPNAPTGCVLALDAIEQLLTANPDSVVLVDETYIDFGGQSAIALVDKFLEPAGQPDPVQVAFVGWSDGRLCRRPPGSD